MSTISHALAGRRALIIGLGLSGQASARFLLKRGVQHLVGVDSNQTLLNRDRHLEALRNCGLHTKHESEPLNVQDFDLVVTSPGIPQDNIFYKQAKENGIEILGEVELACRDIKQRCVAITGTNGKTTVTLLVEHVLNHAGQKAQALGNLGIPLTDAVDNQAYADKETFVIELSSFQLETLKSAFIEAGVILNITPDHLDRYPSLEAYAKSKASLERNIKPGGKLFVEDKCLNDYGSLFTDKEPLSYGYEKSCFIHFDGYDIYYNEQKSFSLPLEYTEKRSHDIENIMAAYALCSHLKVTSQQFLTALASFKKPAHRIQFVRNLHGIQFYDDSKGTNIDAVIRAVESLPGNIVLIAGGVDKGFPYTSWVKAFAGKVSAICAIGQSANKIKNDLKQSIPVEICPSLDKAVERAIRLVHPQGIILLSPGCSSYDMFRDYAHRGKEFQRIVNAL